MSFWIELRCEDRGEEHSYAKNSDINGFTRCWSHDNVGLGVITHENVKDTLSAKTFIEKGARENGWKKIKGEWICAFCVAQRNSKQRKEIKL